MYQNHFQSKSKEYYLSSDYEFKSHILNKELFSRVLDNIFLFNDRQYKKIFEDSNIDMQGISTLASSVLKVAIAEFSSIKIDKKLIISEYLKVADYFLEPYEIKVLNKILETCLINENDSINY